MIHQLDSLLNHHQSYQFIINQQSLPSYLLNTFCSDWDFCSLPHLLPDLDSQQNQSSLSSNIVHLNLFHSSPAFHCTLENTSHTLDDTLFVYDLGASADLTSFKSDFSDYDKCSIHVCNISKINGIIGIVTKNKLSQQRKVGIWFYVDFLVLVQSHTRFPLITLSKLKFSILVIIVNFIHCLYTQTVAYQPHTNISHSYQAVYQIEKNHLCIFEVI